MSSAATPVGSRSRSRPGMSCAMCTALIATSRALAGAVRGTAANASRPRRCVLGLVGDVFQRSRRVVDVEMLTPGACLREDVLERFHLLGDDATSVLEHPESRGR